MQISTWSDTWLLAASIEGVYCEKASISGNKNTTIVLLVRRTETEFQKNKILMKAEPISYQRRDRHTSHDEVSRHS